MAESQPQTTRLPKLSGLSQRLLVSILILISSTSAVALGGWFFAGFVALILGLATWEYWRMYRAGGYRPSLLLLLGGTLAMVAARYLNGFQSSPFLLSVFGLVAMSKQVFDYQRNQKTAALNFSIDLDRISLFERASEQRL